MALKKKYGFDSDKKFFIPDQVKKYYGAVKERGQQKESEWTDLFRKYSAEYPQLASELQRRIEGRMPANWKSNLPFYTPDSAPAATRYVFSVL